MDSLAGASRVKQPQHLSSRLWMPQAALLGFLALALVVYSFASLAALGWNRQSSPGFMVGPGLLVMDVLPSGGDPTLRTGDRILNVDGELVGDGVTLAQALAGQHSAELEVWRAGESVRITLPIRAYPAQSNPGRVMVPMLVGGVFLAGAVWAFVVRRGRASGLVLGLFLTAAGIVTGGLFDFYTTHRFAVLWVIGLSVSTLALFWLGLVFPTGDPYALKRPAIAASLAVLSAAAGLNTLLRITGALPVEGLFIALRIQLAWAAAAAVFLVLWTAWRRGRTSAAIERDQMRLVILGGLFSFSPLLVWMALALLPGAPRLGFTGYPNGYVILPLMIFPVMMGYAIQRFRLQQTDYILTQGALYGLLSVLVTVGYALLVTGFALVAGRIFRVFNPLASGVIFFVLALGFLPLHERTRRAVNAAFFRGDTAFQERLQTFSGALTRAVDLTAILRALREYIETSLQPGRLHIFIYDPLSEQYAATAGKDGRPTSDMRFGLGSPFIALLSGRRGPLVLPEQQTLPSSLAPELPRLSLLLSDVYLPLPGRERLAGWVGLGQRASAEPYSAPELTFVESLCDQAALAIERAQVLRNMENRVRQMNVLARVAQGVNITLAMDDLLELIYAQTTSIIPADEFQILLYDRALETYQYVFYLEGDERLTERENKTVPAGQALEQLVVEQRKPLRTEDYNLDALRNGILVPREGVSAWMGVPLNAGSETIGALSMGSRDARVEYSGEQLNLAQSIADQVAGAIVKARLLQETERRALQLTTLNEVTRKLTSTLELEPLLQNILQNAVEIITCEAGSLLLVDETTDELVFRVVVSPVANDLVNHRIPTTVGAAGKAVRSRQPIMVNDVTRFPEWFSKMDEDTGFNTRTLLVIPLMVKEKPVGVIEVINKRDGTPFSQDDQDLLAAFAAQAAVAMENARLYTLTDQALAARVEELSMMQRIDRELNTSLESAAAMRITLEWALRRTGAQAGLIGTLSEGVLEVKAAQGYNGELDRYESCLPLEQLGLAEILTDPSPALHSTAGKGDGRRLLSGALRQAVVPIRREAVVIGVLFLESTQSSALDEDALQFLVRLCDHAAVSIFNAQLYTAVNNANLAKSEFVSFVAHELKNPMTSVKGYTELLAAGAVGPVSETQTGFLNTIRSNIERMNTLVSDLNDVSKIEVGRLKLDFKAITLADAVEGVVRSTKRQIDEKQQKLVVNLPAGLPSAWADRTRLEQVLVNLVSNAHKYTQAGGEITISAEQAKNVWANGGAPEVLHIQVRDTGIGIHEADQKKIFQKFFRSEDPKTREVPGTGLGLNITKSLVEMQGGQIWFESVYRQGTIFHFTVPVSSQ